MKHCLALALGNRRLFEMKHCLALALGNVLTSKRFPGVIQSIPKPI